MRIIFEIVGNRNSAYPTLRDEIIIIKVALIRPLLDSISFW